MSAAVRDPFGAVLAFTSSDAGESTPVAWHLLAAHDHERPFTFYAKLCGWTAAGEAEVPPESGRHRLFSWDETGSAAGSVTDLARLPHVHPQWLFFFPVADIGRAIADVRRLGGTATDAATGAAGAAVSACEDGQRAAFGLIQLTP